MIIVQAPTIPHFKGLSMRNLQYEIGICQKQHTKVAMSTYANVVTVFLKQSLFNQCNEDFVTFHYLKKTILFYSRSLTRIVFIQTVRCPFEIPNHAKSWQELVKDLKTLKLFKYHQA